MGKLELSVELFRGTPKLGVLTILYRYKKVPVRLLVEAHEMLKSLNLPYSKGIQILG